MKEEVKGAGNKVTEVQKRNKCIRKKQKKKVIKWKKPSFPSSNLNLKGGTDCPAFLCETINTASYCNQCNHSLFSEMSRAYVAHKAHAWQSHCSEQLIHVGT